MAQNAPAANAKTQTERYTEALGGADPLVSLKKAPKRVKKLLRGAKEKELRWKPAPDKWSLHEILAHLADGEVVLGSRMRYVAGEDRPVLVAYDENKFVARLGVDRQDTDELLEDFAAVRRANVRFLARVPEDAFAKSGMHTERGEVTLSNLVTTYAGHDRLHEAQIERTRAAYAAAKKQRKAAKKGATRPAAPRNAPRATRAS